MNAVKAANTELMPGYQFLECLNRTAGRETWTVRTDDGRDRLVQFFSGMQSEGGKEEKGVALLRTLHHDAVEPMELVGVGDDRLALITDVCTKSLASRLRECQAAGLPGIPRPELLARLNEAAEALDDLFEEFGVHHLSLTPRHLAVKNGRLRLLHFGVAELLHQSLGQQTALNPRYSAPRVFEEPHPSSDSYSLALIYCELLTGVHPLPNLGVRQPTSRRHGARPDLSLVSLTDRAVLLRALHADPNRRFASCTDFLAALGAEAANQSMPALTGPTSLLSDSLADSTFHTTTRARMRQLINGLVAGAAGDLEVCEYRNARYLLRPGCHLEHQFFARLARGVFKLMIEGFQLQWNAKMEEFNEQRAVLLVPLSIRFWQRLLGIQPSLKVFISMPQAAATGASQVRVRIEPLGCGREAARGVMSEAAPKVLDSLRTFFHAQPERRSQARLPLDQIMEVAPALDGCSEGDVIQAQARDISMQGMKLCLPCQPPSQRINIHLPGWPADHAASLPASVVRAIPCGDGGYEVSVRFLVEEGPQNR